MTSFLYFNFAQRFPVTTFGKQQLIYLYRPRYRKDLISAMKLPDNEPLTPSEYWVITDPWKQDWERGVQVPVNPDSLPAPKVKIIEKDSDDEDEEEEKPPDFKL